ncbi:MAG: choice-of-anchor D domain-containing protein [Candidatus Hatepunaea meridiana]|nr:choice-of-anchor D domain-containing protein [Candidatus Hatepunaea meridiana]
MKHCRLYAFLIVLITLSLTTSSVIAQELQHFEPVDVTNNFHALVIQSRTLDGEDLVEGDEIGVFCEDGLCVGASVVLNVYDADDEDTQLGISAWPDDDPDDDVKNGFYQDEDMFIRVWDEDQDNEAPGEFVDIQVGRTILHTPGLLICSVEAESIHDPMIEVNAEHQEDNIFSYDFGNTPDGEPIEWTLEITNFGEGNLVVSEIAVVGDLFVTDFNGDEFGLIEPDATAEVLVTFDPEEQGEYDGSLTISSNAVNYRELVINLTGSYLEPAPRLRFSADEYDFRTVLVNSSREWNNFFIYNDGEEDLVISGINTNDEAFTTNFENELTITPNDRELVVVTFSPGEAGDYYTEMTVASNDPRFDEADPFVELSGAGSDDEAPMIFIEPWVEAEEEEPAYSHNFFSVVEIEQTAHWRMVIRNEGSADLVIESIESTNEVYDTDFIANEAARLRPGDFLNVDVTFAPDDEAFFDGELHVTSNDPVFADEDPGYTVVYLGGQGVEEIETHFSYFRTSVDVSHSLLIESATYGDEDLVEGDEIAVFTQSGLCAGGGVVPEDGRTGFSAWGDDIPDDHIINGFLEDEEFIFILWDVDAEMEYEVQEVEFEAGPEAFSSQSWTRVNLIAVEPEPDPLIWVSGFVYHFRQVDFNGEDNESDPDSKEWEFIVRNDGEGSLVIASIESDLNNFEVSYEGMGEEVVLRQHQTLTVEVVFTPDADQEEDERLYIGRITIESNDPVDPTLFVNVDGFGVIIVRESEINLPIDDHFFGVQHIAPPGDDAQNDWEVGPFEYSLTIENIGGARLRIFDVRLEGSDAFESAFENEIMIEPDGSEELAFFFTPGEVGQYDAVFTLVSDDPAREGDIEEDPEEEGDDDHITFIVRGFGSDSEDHFLHHETPTAHTFNIGRAFLRPPDDNEADLGPGDEIAVFTPWGLCAGHVVIEVDEDIVLLAYADNPETEDLVDGFRQDEELTFMFWDWTVSEEVLVDEIEFTGGPEAFDPGAETGISEMSGETDTIERQVAFYMGDDVGHHDFGPVQAPVEDADIEGESAEFTFDILNSGGQVLTVTGASTTNDVFSVEFGDEDIELEHNESFEITVVFTPVEGLAYHDKLVIIHSDDPDEPDFGIHVTGTGSDSETHYDYYRAGTNQSVLVLLTMGGELAGVGDEVGVFLGMSEDDICAGSGTIGNDPEAGAGPSAFADDGDTDFLIEGFADGQRITFRVWDASQQEEYIQTDDEDNPLEIDIIDGDLDWTANARTRVTINVPGVFQIVPVPNQDVDENAECSFDLEIANPPVDDMELEFLVDECDPPLPEGAEVNLEGNTFTWNVGYNAVIIDRVGRPPYLQEYRIRFRAYDPNDEDTPQDSTTVLITVTNVNQEPEVAEGLPNDEAEYDEDAPWTTIIADLNAFWGDEDLDDVDMIYSYSPGVPDSIMWRHIELEEDQLALQVRIKDDWINWNEENNWNGDVECTISCNDQIEDPEEERDANVRILRLTTSVVSDNTTLDPRRDKITDEEFTLHVLPVNDPPVVWNTDRDEPAEDGWEIVVREDEGQVIVIELVARDIEFESEVEDDDLTWSIEDQDDLPDPVDDNWNFTDNGDGTATFTWTPGWADGRDDPYTPVFKVEDGNEDSDLVATSITVDDVNRIPEVVNPPVPHQYVDEDCDRIVLVDLDTLFFDPDGNDLNYRMIVSPPNLRLEIEGSNLYTRPRDNFNTPVEDSMMVEIQADDDHNDVSAVFYVSVVSVNDAPEAFYQLLPQTRMVVPYEMQRMTFTWEEALQNEYERDVVHYNLYFEWRHEAEVDTGVIRNIPRTLIEIDANDLWDSLGFCRDDGDLYGEQLTLLWWVEAEDNGDPSLTTVASNAKFILNIPLTVDGDYELPIPDEYYLAPNFPNPFNAKTTVKFGLPVPGVIEVSVWDMHGRQITVLTSGHHNAGRYQAVWDAGDVTSGVYIIKLESERYRGMQKAILLR